MTTMPTVTNVGNRIAYNTSGSNIHGRSALSRAYTNNTTVNNELVSRGIANAVFYNPILRNDRILSNFPIFEVPYNGNPLTMPGIYAGAINFLSDFNIASRSFHPNARLASRYADYDLRLFGRDTNMLPYPFGYNFNFVYNNPFRSPNYYANGLFTGYPCGRDPFNVYRSYYLPVSSLYAPYVSPYQSVCGGYANPNDCRSCVAAFGGSPYAAQQVCGPHIF